MYEESLRIRRKTFGNEHPSVAESLNNLAQLLRAQVRAKGRTLLSQVALNCSLQGKYDEAKLMHEESLRIRRKALGNEHPDVAQSLNNLAGLCRAQVRVDLFSGSALANVALLSLCTG